MQSALKVSRASGFEPVPGAVSAPPTQAEWDTLLASAATDVVFLTRQWQAIWWGSVEARASCQLHLLSVRDEGGALLGIAPLFVESAPFPPLQPYERGVLRPEGQGEPVRTVRFVGGIDVADYLDIIAPAEHVQAVWEAVFSYLHSIKSEWDAIDLHSLPAASPSKEALSQLAPGLGLEFAQFPEDVCPLVELPDTWEVYLMGLDKKDRHELRRKVRKLEGRDDVRWYLVDPTDAAALQKGMEAFIELHRKSGEDKARFMTEGMAASFLEMAATLAPTGWLDLAILEVNREPAAAYLSYNYKGRLYLYNSGYDPRFASYSAGVALLAYRIHKAILQGIKVFDFLRGDEEYKYDFGAKDTYIYRMVIRRDE